MPNFLSAQKWLTAVYRMNVTTNYRPVASRNEGRIEMNVIKHGMECIRHYDTISRL
jgi:hypothetical protein